jgi:inositol-phosphate phosphatase / L-galactose 1-phosphate phosphatase / histidinol-phosphatase
MQDLIAFANHLADEAGAVLRPFFRQSLTIDTKGDESPVTQADRSVEQRLRTLIEGFRPDDGILGEEYGIKPSKNAYDWVIDPIDGTKSFIIGRPSFGTLIALCENGKPILGVIDQPILRERWVGNGKFTTFNNKPATTHNCSSLKEATVISTDPYYIQKLWPLLHKECKMFIWGGDCYSYGLLSNGWADVVVEQGLAPYDYLALVPIVQGAGGWMGDWGGAPLMLSSDHNKNGQTLALGDARLKDDVLNLLSD